MIATKGSANGNGTNQELRNRLPASVIQSMQVDPASVVPGAPPNFGRQAVPHIFTVSARYGNNVYEWLDECTRDSRENGQRMRADCGIMECVEARQRATALLKWHISPEDEKSADQKELASQMTKILEATPRFVEMRRNLLEAIWFGRYATAGQFGVDWVGGKRRTVLTNWEPRNGDKIVFRWDDGKQKFDPRQIGIRIAAGYDAGREGDVAYDHRKVQATQYGLAYWLDNWERRTVILHKHMIEDADFMDPQRAGAIHGVGVRDRIYWTWYAMVECLQRALEYIDRSAFGVEIWRYPAHNPTAKARTEQAAKEHIGGGRSIILVPVEPGENADEYGLQVVEPGFGGVEAVVSLIKEYFGHKIKRYILGQTLTSEAEATGLGSGVADAHMATFADIVQYDAINLGETLTTDYLRPLQLWNFPKSASVRLRFVIDTEQPDTERRLAAYQAAWNMGAELKAEDVLGMIGASMPQKGDKILQNPQLAGGMGGPINAGGNGGDAAAAMAGHLATQLHGQSDKYQAADEPTEAQREAGNYKKHHVRVHGLDISIENRKGTRRRPEWPKLSADYGYIKRTTGRDGDHVDVFLGPDRDSEIVFVVDQVSKAGRFDEHKVLIGWTNEDEAKAAYLKNYTSGWKCGPITSMTIDQFKRWLLDGDTTQRVAGQVARYGAEFDESKIKRDDDGQFAAKEGGSGGGKSSSESPKRGSFTWEQRGDKHRLKIPGGMLDIRHLEIVPEEAENEDGSPATVYTVQDSDGYDVADNYDTQEEAKAAGLDHVRQMLADKREEHQDTIDTAEKFIAEQTATAEKEKSDVPQFANAKTVKERLRQAIGGKTVQLDDAGKFSVSAMAKTDPPPADKPYVDAVNGRKRTITETPLEAWSMSYTGPQSADGVDRDGNHYPRDVKYEIRRVREVDATEGEEPDTQEFYESFANGESIERCDTFLAAKQSVYQSLRDTVAEDANDFVDRRKAIEDELADTIRDDQQEIRDARKQLAKLAEIAKHFGGDSSSGGDGSDQRPERLALRFADAFTEHYAAKGGKRKASPGQGSVFGKGGKGEVSGKQQGQFRWVTLNADNAEGGGTPVKIDGEGNIHAGPDGLAGKHLGEIDKGVKDTEHDRRGHNFNPATKRFEKKPAQKTSEPPENSEADRQKHLRKFLADSRTKKHVDEIAGEKHKAATEVAHAREKAKQVARQRLGVNAGQIRQLENQGFDHASGKVKGLDTLGRELASEFPELGWGRGYESGDIGTDDTDHAANLWDLLREGKQEQPSLRSFTKAARDELEGIFHDQYDRGVKNPWDVKHPEPAEEEPFSLRRSRAAVRAQRYAVRWLVEQGVCVRYSLFAALHV